MEQIISVIKKSVQQLFGLDIDVQLSRPDQQFGDFATNVAMQIAKNAGKNPREIAEQLASSLRESGEFSDVTVAGPGFINIRIKDDDLTLELSKIINNPSQYGKLHMYDGKVVLTEYSDPNPFKVLHVGHLYTSNVGDAISNLVENAGGQVHRLNFGGDVGLHVAKAMWSIIKHLGGELPEKLLDIEESDHSEFMARCYVEGNSAYEGDETAKSEITVMNARIYAFIRENDHESPAAQIYWTCRQWSYDYFDAFYARIGTKFEKYYPESTVTAIGLATVLEQKAKGVFADSNGATVFVGEPYGLHTRVFINSAGLATYEAKDLGLNLAKWEDYHFDKSIIITGSDIIEYMKVLMKAIEQFRPELPERTQHITHGMVKLVGGTKMASRKGNFLRAIDVIDMVADANEKAQGNRDDAPVLGAIKYAFLKSRIGADIVFDPKESVSLQGNSGPYLQYSLARANSIVQKVDSIDKQVTTPDGGYTEYEKNLLFKLTEYIDAINQSTNELLPHILCTYLYELAQVFNRFYENSKVVGDEREQIRLKLVTAYVSILKNGLTILGVPTPDRM